MRKKSIFLEKGNWGEREGGTGGEQVFIEKMIGIITDEKFRTGVKA